MEKHIALCLEDLNASHHDERFVQCVALYGREPGLCLDGQGCPLWQTKTDAVCELWRSADGRLVLWKLPNTSSIIVRRASRVLEVPPEKPVILLDKDEIDVGSKTLRVHLHGTTSRMDAPRPLVTRPQRNAFRVAASTVALGATLVASTAGSAQESPRIEVREHPPAPPRMPDPPEPPDAGDHADNTQPANSESGAVLIEDDAQDSAAGDETIEVRETPPAPPPPIRSGGCCSKQPGT
ncbi:MAG TPA: hypothetical protein PKL24_16915 [Polyangiaceae bacterium]|jgi:hypothetical protein|nr:MAG: hypothetical protein BWY17_02858 [Deltaproteobacteria bacterium ADurb.Bin207]HNZ23829.1 hypothetical protein [Polyangiaceae bacterium]HOD22378.1 hypothetical protein [Polyangiaceae bacterium]HOE50555.1 hypothetical protein [Polyangiaceae bacterium]HOH01597.1 hypothetical protein [Polyangiaceae bacterium]